MEQFGRYELRRRLGVGGMAEVYEAVALVAEGVEKPLVIKRILEEHSKDPRFVTMFVDEARVALKLSHPNIVQVFDFGKVDDRYFLAMEFVRGKDLGALISRAKQGGGPVPPEIALFIAGEVAKGLDHVHRATGQDGRPIGLVHRDVSPQNILISTEGSVKISDFGIAKFNSREGTTQIATVRGKVRYMSPEQVESLTLDGRSDLFSLGVVLYEMLTGTYCFDGKSDFEVLAAVRRARPVSASQIARIPSGTEQVLDRVMAREPRERHARGNDLQRDLERVALSAGLRATSGALAEYLAEKFPELQRTSDGMGATVIRRMEDLETNPGGDSTPGSVVTQGPQERTRIRRMPDGADGVKVFVSEEVRAEPSSAAGFESTAEGSAAREVEATRAQTELDELRTQAELDEMRVEAERDQTGLTPFPRESTDRSSRAHAPDDRTPFPMVQVRTPGRTETTVGRGFVPPEPTANAQRNEQTDVRMRLPPPEPPPAARVQTRVPSTVVAGSDAAPERRSSVAAPMIRGPNAPARSPWAGPLVAALVVVGLAAAALVVKKNGWLSPALAPLHASPAPVGISEGGQGFLSLSGFEGGQVAVDGVVQGSLPLPSIPVSAGIHSVTVINGNRRIDFAVHVDPSQTIEKDLDATLH